MMGQDSARFTSLIPAAGSAYIHMGNTAAPCNCDWRLCLTIVTVLLLYYDI
jgi:hypothetical protein